MAASPLKIAAIPGDGVGAEVSEVALEVLETVAKAQHNLTVEVEGFPWGSAYYRDHGSMAPPDLLEILQPFDAILFGAVGWPDVPDHVSLWGLRLAIVQGFDQYLNVRPCRLLPGTASPLEGRTADEIDSVVVRENSEGEYAGAGGRVHRGLLTEVAVQTSIYSRLAIERTARAAFEIAMQRPARRLASVTKSNASQYASVLWDEVVAEVARDYADVAFESVLVDAATARFVLDPGSFDVVLGSNLHSDILSDLASALAGSLGVGPSANYDPFHRHPSMFEPIHGSAPDIAGKAIANPIAAVLCVAMMLDHLEHTALGNAIRGAVDSVCSRGVLTRDLGGSSSTAEVRDALVEHLTTHQLEKQ